MLRVPDMSRLTELPSNKTVRTMEHIAALYVAYRAIKAVWTLGPSGIKKAAVGVFLSASRHVPLISGKIKEEEDVSVGYFV